MQARQAAVPSVLAMISLLFEALRSARLRTATLGVLLAAPLRAQAPLPPPSSQSARLSESVVRPSTRAPQPEPEADTLKLRIDGEYELRQCLLTAYRLPPYQGGPADLDQTTRLYHWLRLRPLLLVGERWEVRAEADLPRGMIYGNELEGVPDSGTDFDRQQPLRVQLRMLRVTLRGKQGEISLGHTTTELGLGLLDNAGDAPRWFGTPDQPATYERLEVSSGDAASTLRVTASGDLLFDNGKLALTDGDQLWRVGLKASYSPSERTQLSLLSRYETLRPRDGRGSAQVFVLDASGGFRVRLPGQPGELFGQYEGIYRIGSVGEPTAFASSGSEPALTELGGAVRVGVALERTETRRRYAHLVVSLEWGMASGDADPTDDELHRFVMNPNHGVGVLLFGELLRFKTSRAQALLAEQDAGASEPHASGLATSGGVAGATYLNPVLLMRPSEDVTLKLGGVVASATTRVVDPSRLAQSGERRNFDGGSPLGRSLGSELDLGGELNVPLEPPTALRLSLEGALAFPGNAFNAASGERLGTQALVSAGLGVTF